MKSIVVTSLILATVLVGCGGGGTQPKETQQDALQTAAMARAEKVTEANIVVTAASGAVSAEGGYQSLSAKLARGESVMRGTDAVTRFHFAVTLPLGGDYRVYGWWPQGIEGSGPVTAVVRDVMGEVSVGLDQSEDGGRWVPIGVFRFDSGRPARVSLVSSDGSLVVADALRFEHLDGERAGTRVDTEMLPLANEVSAYEAVLEGSGRPPLRWSLTSGELPHGLVLDPASGRINGLPGGRGEYRFEVSLSDARGQQARRWLQVDVLESLDQPAPPASARSAPTERRLDGTSSGGRPDLGGLLAMLDSVPEGSWVRVNLNSFSEVWTPAAQRPLLSKSNPDPSNIIQAWSSFAWDPKRGDLWIYGGGHANYNGNDVYRWRGTTQMWERASLPSQIKSDDLGNVIAVDGPFKAPTAAHTYDNAIFLPITDRLLTFGGAASGRGGSYKLQIDATTQRNTGPYMFDPTRADATKVGGSTGSHVQRVAPFPEVLGGEMWTNRDLYGNQPVGTSLPSSFVNGCTGYAEENGRDVVYIGGRSGSTALGLYKYIVGDLDNPTSDVVERPGRYWNGTTGQTSCAVHPHARVLLRTGENPEPFFYWNLATASSSNRDVLVVPTDPSGEFGTLLASGAINITRCGMDYDPVRRHFVLWCAGGTVWSITPPAGAMSPVGWVIQKQPLPVGATPGLDPGKGILGKWKYISNLDAFMGLQDNVNGNIWVYKPIGWQRPSGVANARPTVSLIAPLDGAHVESGQPIQLTADAADANGQVMRVEFYNGVTKIGEASSGSPFTMTWPNPPVGTLSIRAVATDDVGASTTSTPITIAVLAGASGTLILQDGQAGYAASRDTYLSSYHPSRSFGPATSLTDQYSRYTSLIGFAVFDHEGGPVPSGAQIASARLMVYKSSKYNMRYQLHPMLVPWTEGQSTWNESAPGVAWGAPGARSPGIDHAVAPDAVADVGYEPGWMSFDVTAAVQRMRDAPMTSHGWAILGISGYVSGLKKFNTREIPADVHLRPKLEITYEQP